MSDLACPTCMRSTRSGSPAAIVRSCRSPAGGLACRAGQPLLCPVGGPTAPVRRPPAGQPLLSGPPVPRRANRSCPGPRSPGGPTAPSSRCPPLKTDGDATTMGHRDPGPGDGARKQILQRGGVRTPRPRAIRYISRFRQRPEIRELARSYLPVVERRDGSRPARWAGFAPSEPPSIDLRGLARGPSGGFWGPRTVLETKRSRPAGDGPAPCFWGGGAAMRYVAP